MLASRLLHLFEFLISDITLYMLIRCTNIYVLPLKEKVLELLKWDFQLVFASSELLVST